MKPAPESPLFKGGKVYVIHEYGDPSHYEGLKLFCDKQGVETSFYEFSFFTQFTLGIKKGNRKLIKRAINNFGFLFNLLFLKNKTIVLGIAPFDYRMIFFNFLAKRNNIFYHTSWPYWDKSVYPKKLFYKRFNATINRVWKSFLEKQCSAIFSVSNYGKEQLRKNYQISAPIQVVYHSVNKQFFYPGTTSTHNGHLKIFFAGRLIEKKGILEILKLLECFPEDKITIGLAGDGELMKTVQQHKNYGKNLKYYGRLDKKRLGEVCREYDVLICPSKKGYGTWEELFGMTIIEGMACGLIPLASDHVGPKETIEHGVNGFLLRNDYLFEDLLFYIDYLLKTDTNNKYNLKRAAIKKGVTFYSSEIAQHWGNTFNQYYNI